MNESERISSLEKRLNDVESILDKICKHSDVCGYKGETEHREHEEESPIEKLKRSLE